MYIQKLNHDSQQYPLKFKTKKFITLQCSLQKQLLNFVQELVQIHKIQIECMQIGLPPHRESNHTACVNLNYSK